MLRLVQPDYWSCRNCPIAAGSYRTRPRANGVRLQRTIFSTRFARNELSFIVEGRADSPTDTVAAKRTPDICPYPPPELVTLARNREQCLKEIDRRQPVSITKASMEPLIRLVFLAPNFPAALWRSAMNSLWFENALDTRLALMSASALVKRASITRRWAGVYSRSTISFGVRTILPMWAVASTRPPSSRPTSARRNGHLALALYFNDAHGDSLPRSRKSNFLKRMVARRRRAVNGTCPSRVPDLSDDVLYIDCIHILSGFHPAVSAYWGAIAPYAYKGIRLSRLGYSKLYPYNPRLGCHGPAYRGKPMRRTKSANLGSERRGSRPRYTLRSEKLTPAPELPRCL